MGLNDQQEQRRDSSSWEFSALSAICVRCTLKRSPELSHTEGLIQVSKQIMDKNSISTELLGPADHEVAYGVQPDMEKHGWKQNDWPEWACPNCWGRYEYDGQIRKVASGRQIEVNNGIARHSFIQDFVVIHTDGIRLRTDSSGSSRPKCPASTPTSKERGEAS